MLIKENKIDQVSLFFSSNQKSLAAKNHQIIDLTDNRVLTDFTAKISVITSSGQDTYASDIYGNCKKIRNGSVEDFEKSVAQVLTSSRSIAHLENPDRTALIDPSGNIIWDMDFFSIDFVYDDNLIFMEDSRDDANSKIVAISLSSGSIVWSKSMTDFGAEATFDFFIGVDDTNLYLLSDDPLSIIILNKNNGTLVRTFNDNTLPTSNKLSFDFFKLDVSQDKLVSPLGEIVLTTSQYTPNDFTSYHDNISIPEIYPFAFNDTHVFFGIQKHLNAQTDQYQVIGELMVLDRASRTVVYAERINDDYADSGIQQMSLSEGKLYVLDSHNILTIYTM
ncbi:hypothetical protein BKI52_10460 [marine bacterium AO1-C]|nr:hypothetical protein BKI52_10460 [marine bacterium AO1-C]